MRTRDIQRSIRLQRIERRPGDAPSIGRVERVRRGSKHNGRQKRRRRGSSAGSRFVSANRRIVIMVWSGLLGLVALAALGVFLFTWLRSEMKQRASIRAQVPQAAPQVRVVSKFESPSEEFTMQLVKDALALRDEAQVERYFRMGAATAADIIAFLGKMEASDGVVTGCQWLSSMDANGLLIEGVLVNSQLEGATRNRLALLTPDAMGVWKIDFEAFARSVRPPWPELLEGRASEGMVRVIVAQDSYYNGVFADEGAWLCYGMASPDISQILVGYCRKDSPQAKAMEEIVKRADDLAAPGRQIKRATVEIRRPAGAALRQFEITRVLAEDWIVSERPFDAAH